MFSCYLKMERHQSIRKDGTESKTPRYVVTASAGYFQPLEAMKGKDGRIAMFCQRNDKCNPKSTSETRLQCKGSINFSSIYFLNLRNGETLIGYGEPPKQRELKAGKGTKPNPFYNNKEDGYLFIVSPDQKTIEILIIPGGRMLIQGYAAKLADGRLNEGINEMRKAAKSE
jgi:hypothetical protein